MPSLRAHGVNVHERWRHESSPPMSRHVYQFAPFGPLPPMASPPPMEIFVQRRKKAGGGGGDDDGGGEESALPAVALQQIAGGAWIVDTDNNTTPDGYFAQSDGALVIDTAVTSGFPITADGPLNANT